MILKYKKNKFKTKNTFIFKSKVANSPSISILELVRRKTSFIISDAGSGIVIMNIIRHFGCTPVLLSPRKCKVLGKLKE